MNNHGLFYCVALLQWSDSAAQWGRLRHKGDEILFHFSCMMANVMLSFYEAKSHIILIKAILMSMITSEQYWWYAFLSFLHFVIVGFYYLAASVGVVEQDIAVQPNENLFPFNLNLYATYGAAMCTKRWISQISKLLS